MSSELTSHRQPAAPPVPGRGLRRRSGPLGELRRRDPQLRHVVLKVRSWGLKRGLACSTDALTVVVGLAIDGGRAGHLSPKAWTVARVESVLRGDGLGWSIAHGADPPADLGHALVLWIEFLDAHQAFGPGSDGPDELRAAASKRRRRARPGRGRHPAGRGLA